MSGKTMQRDRKISSKLVHIEQVIDLAKSFKILTLSSNRTEAKLRYDTSPPVEHPNNTLTVFLFYM
jgi:hypothetical protein